ncbi:dehydrogenase [Shinella zoogloeoides]|uniref:dehydrogenase n=1 Tax=Shinella zoogloeoides TaxID=352475 RepID=UPI0028AC1708|nr:dehydrogenase [Shinella zoogloeoides]
MRPLEKQPTLREEAAEILALHDGNALEALRTLIAERDAIEERLAIATLVMGRGFTRGWRP